MTVTTGTQSDSHRPASRNPNISLGVGRARVNVSTEGELHEDGSLVQAAGHAMKPLARRRQVMTRPGRPWPRRLGQRDAWQLQRAFPVPSWDGPFGSAWSQLHAQVELAGRRLGQIPPLEGHRSE